MIEDLGSHAGKTIVLGYDRHLLPELDAYERALAAHGGPIETAVDPARLHYLTSAERVGRRVARQPAAVGVLICLTGLGVSIAANKLRGVYAARCLDADDARAARTVNNANVLCLSVARGLAVNRTIIDAFLTTPYQGRKLDELVYLRALELAAAVTSGGGGRAGATARAAASNAWPTAGERRPWWDEPG